MSQHYHYIKKLIILLSLFSSSCASADENILYSFHMYEPFAFSFSHFKNASHAYKYSGDIAFGEIPKQIPAHPKTENTFIKAIKASLVINRVGNVADLSSINTAFIAKKDGKEVKTHGEYNKQYPPCSTFKVALALMGFDAGILIDKDSPKWSFKKEYEANFPPWYRPEMGIKYGWHGEHTPKTYMQKSVLWFSHQITQRLGKENFHTYVNKLNYGNKDTSGMPGQDDGLLNSWLETSLKISPREQVELLEKMLAGDLKLSQDTQKKTKEIMVQRDMDGQAIRWNGWNLYGKTGGGTGCNRWFIGWVEKGAERIVFAQYIGLTKDSPELRAAAAIAIDAAKENILPLTGGEREIHFNNRIGKLQLLKVSSSFGLSF